MIPALNSSIRVELAGVVHETRLDAYSNSALCSHVHRLLSITDCFAAQIQRNICNCCESSLQMCWGSKIFWLNWALTLLKNTYISNPIHNGFCSCSLKLKLWAFFITSGN